MDVGGKVVEAKSIIIFPKVYKKIMHLICFLLLLKTLIMDTRSLCVEQTKNNITILSNNCRFYSRKIRYTWNAPACRFPTK